MSDAATAQLTRPSVGRICVEMDLLRIEFGLVVEQVGFSNQPVKYEKVQKYFTSCLRQGHDNVECKMVDTKRMN